MKLLLILLTLSINVNAQKKEFHNSKILLTEEGWYDYDKNEYDSVLVEEPTEIIVNIKSYPNQDAKIIEIKFFTSYGIISNEYQVTHYSDLTNEGADAGYYTASNYFLNLIQVIYGNEKIIIFYNFSLDHVGHEDGTWDRYIKGYFE